MKEDRHGAMVFIFLKVFLMVGMESLKLSSRSFIEGMCVVTRAPVVMIRRGSTFEPLAIRLAISGLYLFIFVVSVSGENWSLQ